MDKEFSANNLVSTESISERDNTITSPAQTPGKRSESAKPIAIKGDTSNSLIAETEPWPNPVDGKELIDEIKTIINDHVSLPDHADTAIALWILLTYVYEEFDVLPLLLISSPTKRCGKTTLLELVTKMSYRSLSSSNFTGPALFRTVDQFKPTLVLDEADTFIPGNEDLRGILNSGYTRSNANVIRLTGSNFSPTVFSTWCPKVIACIGGLADTLVDRSILALLKRKTSSKRLRRLRACANFMDIQQKCKRWADDNGANLERYDGSDLKINNDRAIDNWEVLLSIASHCDTLNDAIQCAEALSETAEDLVKEDLILLLEDLRQLFENHEKLTSQYIVDHLNSLEDRSWSEISNGRGMTPAKLARMLSEFDIKPGAKSFTGHKDGKRGYYNADFDEAFTRYLS